MLCSLNSYVGIYVLILTDTHTLRILINPPITTTTGERQVNLVCYIDKSDDEKLLSPVITIEIYNKTLQTFDPIVIFPFKDVPLLTPAGQYLQNRVTLSASNATISFHKITCEDEKTYICTVAYTDGNGNPRKQYSDITSIKITSPSQKPFDLTSTSAFNGLHEFQNVTFVCKGHVGNPPENFKWIHYRRGSLYKVYNDVLTSTTRNADNCTYLGISELNLTISLLDDEAVIGCAVNASNNLDDAVIKTPAFNVFYKVRDIMVAKSPNADVYEEDSNNYLNMSCYANGNPPANYAWHEWTRSMQKNTSLLTLQMTADNSGIYQCFAINTFENKTYNTSTSVNITIVAKLKNNTATLNEDSYSNALLIVLAILIPSFGMTVIVVVTWKRHRQTTESISGPINVEGFDETHTYDGVDYNQMTFATPVNIEENTDGNYTARYFNQNHSLAAEAIVQDTSFGSDDIVNEGYMNPYQPLQNNSLSCTHLYESTGQGNMSVEPVTITAYENNVLTVNNYDTLQMTSVDEHSYTSI